LGFIGTVGSWVLMSYFGRRTLYMGGLVVLLFVLIGIGGAGFAPTNELITQTKRSAGPSAAGGSEQIAVNRAASWAVGSLLLFYTLIYDFTVGPVCYAIVAGIQAPRHFLIKV
jgi:SP family general alpha glucoside:H+ symporter-like MFS transporter